MSPTHVLDVLIRLHTTERLTELGRCLFSLVCQDYAPLHVVLVTQRFDEAQLGRVRAFVAPYAGYNRLVRLEVVNRADPLPKDARSALLNAGLQACHGRYLAFLDYDDVIYERAYTTLTRALENHRVAVAFGNIHARICQAQDDLLLTRQRRPLFSAGRGALDLFRDNHCPIHSFVIDRSRVDDRDLWFDESLTRLEDYDFLLRLCAKYASCFVNKNTFVGDYYIKDDGSNSVHASHATETNDDAHAAWRHARSHVRRTKATLRLSEQVHRRLGLPAGRRNDSLLDLIR